MNECWISEKTVAESRERSGTGAGRFAGRQGSRRSLHRLMKVWGMRRHVRASEPLFLHGDDARYWYFLEAGSLRIFAPGADGVGSRAPLLRPAAFFSFGSGGRHELVCRAVEASTVICFDRRQVESQARHDHALEELLKDTARWELELTLCCASDRLARSHEDKPAPAPGLRQPVPSTGPPGMRAGNPKMEHVGLAESAPG